MIIYKTPTMRHKRLCVLLVCAMVMCYIVWTLTGNHGNHGVPGKEGMERGGVQRPPGYARDPTLPPLSQQDKQEDFLVFPGPERITHNPTIPHIIHQVWDTTDIPRYFAKFVRSWQDTHPDWEYWFWTHQDADDFVRAEFPKYYSLYNSYISPIFRADAMRYFVLYKYGGVYVDLDTEALKPLDNWTYGYQCILSQECYEHSFVVQEREHANLLNGFLATRPGHPFFRNLIESLPEYAGQYFGNYIKATGPMFLDAVYRKHKYNYTTFVTSSEDRVTVVPPRFFMPTYDPSQSEIISSRCHPLQYRNLKANGQRACKHLQQKFFQNKPESDSYTNHEWIHAHEFDRNWKTSNNIDLYKLAPQARRGSDFFEKKFD